MLLIILYINLDNKNAKQWQLVQKNIYINFGDKNIKNYKKIISHRFLANYI